MSLGLGLGMYLHFFVFVFWHIWRLIFISLHATTLLCVDLFSSIFYFLFYCLTMVTFIAMGYLDSVLFFWCLWVVTHTFIIIILLIMMLLNVETPCRKNDQRSPEQQRWEGWSKQAERHGTEQVRAWLQVGMEPSWRTSAREASWQGPEGELAEDWRTGEDAGEQSRVKTG